MVADGRSFASDAVEVLAGPDLAPALRELFERAPDDDYRSTLASALSMAAVFGSRLDIDRRIAIYARVDEATRALAVDPDLDLSHDRSVLLATGLLFLLRDNGHPIDSKEALTAVLRELNVTNADDLASAVWESDGLRVQQMLLRRDRSQPLSEVVR